MFHIFEAIPPEDCSYRLKNTEERIHTVPGGQRRRHSLAVIVLSSATIPLDMGEAYATRVGGVRRRRQRVASMRGWRTAAVGGVDALSAYGDEHPSRRPQLGQQHTVSMRRKRRQRVASMSSRRECAASMRWRGTAAAVVATLLPQKRIDGSRRQRCESVNTRVAFERRRWLGFHQHLTAAMQRCASTFST